MIKDELIVQHMSQYDTRLLEHPVGRKEVTKYDPLAFAIIYMPHHLKDMNGDISFSEFHHYLCEYGQQWARPLQGQIGAERDCFIAPRECGKSTWLFLILPLWAAAHGHLKFIAAFAHAATQAETHLQSFKRELDSNDLLILDFPDLCTPMRRSASQQKYADSRNLIIQSNGFIFAARGIDSANLGLKIGAMRPQLLILDDIEPGEANYSDYEVEKRLETVLSDIFPLNSFAKVAIVGTTTKNGSIIHQIVETALGRTHDWVDEAKINAHYFPALSIDEEGSYKSVWPYKWPVEMLLPQVNSRSFRKNFQCLPANDGESFWTESTFTYEQLPDYGRTILSIDPAVTSGKKSDFTGLAVISRHPDPAKRELFIRHAEQIKASPRKIRERIMALITQFPEISFVLVETNQGGDMWSDLLSNLPVRHEQIKQKDSKTTRAEQALWLYERGAVKHERKIPMLEEQMCNFPHNTVHDDMVDAVTSGVLWFSKQKKQRKSRSFSYLG